MESRFRISGMDCASCASKIGGAVKRLPGVETVDVSAAAASMAVRHSPETQVGDIVRRVEELGYGIARLPAAERSAEAARPSQDAAQDVHGHSHREEFDGSPWRSRKAALTAACGLALLIAFGVGKAAPGLSDHAFAIAMLVGLGPIAWRALTAARYGTPFSIETLMTVAAIGAVFIGAAEEAGAVVFLFLIGELLEGVATGRARSGIRALADLAPRTALLEVDGRIAEVAAETLAKGSVILARPGDRIAADGVILSGNSQIDEAPITGESVPRTKGPGDPVFAGTINGDAALRIEVTAAAADNTIARVVRLVEEAQEAKAPTERLIDRFSRYYTPAVAATAALVAVVPPLAWGGAWSEWIYKGLAILLIGCPCALVISVPAAVAAGLSAGARRGLLMKGGAVLENAGKIAVACFDKTGTLTQGKPVVTDLHPIGLSQNETLALAAAVESGSSHPLAQAILAMAEREGVEIPPAQTQQSFGGKGVGATVGGRRVAILSPTAARERAELPPGLPERIASCADEGKTVSLVLVDDEVKGLLAMRDQPRADAKAGLAALHALGVKTLMLTGDNRRTAEAVGKELGIETHAELLPQQKLEIVENLRKAGNRVAKIGDGVNDAPALAAADIGVAMGGGADVALETADAAALHGRVGDVAAMMKLSRATLANIRQNIVVALGFKAVFLVTTVLGLTGLWPAILADTGATVLVTANALRLLAWRPN